MTSTDRLLGLINAAYDVADGSDRFDRFLGEAERYLFNGEVNGQIAPDVRHVPGSDPLLDSHADRILQTVSRAFAQVGKSDERNHAVLVVNSGGTRVTGNRAAEELMDVLFPCALKDLPLDHSTRLAIQRSTAPGKVDGKSEEILLTTIETPQPKSCLALVRHQVRQGDAIEISISYIDWSPQLISQLGGAFGLTETETEILEGYLRKQSQKEIAERRDRSLQTVKVQSKTILRKTGCSRMSDVVQLSAGIAYLLRQMPNDDVEPSKNDWVTPKQNMNILRRPDGRKLAWYRIGSGAQPALFVHGLVQGPFFTAALIAEISQAGFYLICPSRPGFGYSDPSSSRASYNQDVVDDARNLLNHLGVASCVVLGHQGGTSHAFRTANALGDNCKSLLIVDGGVPLNEAEDFASIDPNSRLLAAAARRSPSMLKMITRVSKAVYRKRGVSPFLKKTYGASGPDLAALKDPELLSVLSAGVYHVAEQSSEIWVRDGDAAMQDWSADFTCGCPRQFWIQARQAKTLDVEVVERRLKSLPCASLTIVPDAGNTLLYTHPHVVAKALIDIHT